MRSAKILIICLSFNLACGWFIGKDSESVSSHLKGRNNENLKGLNKKDRQTGQSNESNNEEINYSCFPWIFNPGK